MSGIKGGKDTGTESETAGDGTATTAMSIGRGAMAGNGTASGQSTIGIVTDLGKSGLIGSGNSRLQWARLRLPLNAIRYRHARCLLNGRRG
jgi:hypothetical protein